MRLSRVAAFCLLLLLPCMAQAGDLGPDQAEMLHQQLDGWLAGLLGPAVKLPRLPWRFTGNHDHYAVSLPLPGSTGPQGDVAVTANIRPLDGGQWSIDDLRLPPSAAFTITMPKQGVAAKNAPLDMQFSVGRQDVHGLIDPALTSASTLHTELDDLVVLSSSGDQHQEQRIDRYRADASLTPASDGRLDFAMQATAGGWKSASQINGQTPVAIGIEAVRAVGRISGVKRDHVAALLAATGGLIGALPSDVSGKSDETRLPAPARAQMRLMVEALQDMLTAVSLEETADGLRVEVAGLGGISIRKLQLGFGGEAPDGRLHAWIDVAVDELASPSLPPRVAAYLPHHIEVRPSLSGIQTADLYKLALDATDAAADAKDLAPDMDTIFSHGGADLGLETLSFDLGPAKLTGVGHALVTSPGSWHGEAHLVASGFDELATQARSNPDLQQALPALIMLRGLAKPDEGRLVWDIVGEGATLTVNGLDLSELGGTHKPHDKAPTKPAQPPKR